MKGLKYQLKNICKDKLCILSFLLPIVVGLAINLLAGMSLSAINETAFGIVKNDLPQEAILWLHENGHVEEFADTTALENAVNDPATQMIAVLRDQDGIKTLRSGDELQLNQVIADTLPQIYAEQGAASMHEKTVIIPGETNSNGIKSLLIVITLLTAMFMGCTFNAMSIISEKEDGIAFINEVLPLTKRDYIVQKVALGFIGGVVSTVLTAIVCVRIEAVQILPLISMIVLSSFIAALTGLFIGRFSGGLMIGIVYIKLVMILFLAPPIVFYMLVPADCIVHNLSYLLPSSAACYGLMDLLGGQDAGVNLVVLLAHCIFWTLLFFVINKRYKKV